MLKRSLSTLVLMPPILAAIWFGAPYFEAVILIAGIIVILEWSQLSNRGDIGVGGWLSVAVFAAAILVQSFQDVPAALIILGAGSACLLVAGILGRRAENLWSTAGLVYVGLACSALIWLRADPDLGRGIVIWFFVIVWATDIGAYLTGRGIGGVKLAPRISPNKTWAGLIGGIAAAGLAAALLAGAAGERTVVSLHLAAVFGAILAIVSQFGDLLESGLKRHFNVKDSGRLIPGHGGLLDRVDGVLLAAPVAAIGKFAWAGGIMPWK